MKKIVKSLPFKLLVGVILGIVIGLALSAAEDTGTAAGLAAGLLNVIVSKKYILGDAANGIKKTTQCNR